MHRVFTLELDWNGSLLVARTELGHGWRLLADRVPVKMVTRSIHAGELEDLSPFDLGVFLADACRQFTYEWEQAREQELQSATLFDELPGERD